MSLTIGTAPDSWGVWFPSDPQQVSASTFLAEVAEAGYEAIELGPYGYLPTDPAELTEALAAVQPLGAGRHGVLRSAQPRVVGRRLEAGDRRRRPDPGRRR